MSDEPHDPPPSITSPLRRGWKDDRDPQTKTPAEAGDSALCHRRPKASADRLRRKRIADFDAVDELDGVLRLGVLGLVGGDVDRGADGGDFFEPPPIWPARPASPMISSLRGLVRDILGHGDVADGCRASGWSGRSACSSAPWSAAWRRRRPRRLMIDLHRALAEASQVPTSVGALAVLQGAGDDFGRRGRAPVDQHHHRQIGDLGVEVVRTGIVAERSR